MSTADPAFTIFTPTYNRAHSLHRVWDSLRDQSFRDFEWLIVDNASTDGTEALVADWIEDGSLAIRYLRNEENIGRQGSWQRAIEEARGELFVEMRSADGCTPDALAVLHAQWMSIPDEERHRFSAVSGLAVDERGQLIGTPFPFDVTDSDSLEIRYRYRVKGDKWGFQRTSVLREQQIPRIWGYVGEIPERVVWRAIARRYRTRYVNQRLRVFWQDQTDRLSRPPRPWVNAPGRLLDAEDLLNHDLRWFRYRPFTFYREAAAYVCSGWHAGRGPWAQAAALRPMPAKALWLLALPIGTACYLIQRWLPALGQRLPNP
jgi:glycosyltransferase involved in cell wall biosynthesis